MGKPSWEQIAARRLTYLRPDNAGKVLGHDRYWTLPFLRLYLDHCDEEIFENPQSGYLFAQHAPELARRIRVGYTPEDYESDTDKRSWMVRALAVWGSSCRACSENIMSKAAYEKAFELCTSGGVDNETLGMLYTRAAFLYMTIDEVDRAVALIDSAVARLINQQTLVAAEAFAIRCAIRVLQNDSRSVEDAVRAAQRADLSDRGERIRLCMLHNLAAAVSRDAGATFDQQSAALKALIQIRKGLAKRSLSMTKSTLYWVEGLLLQRLGSTRLAKRRISKARLGFLNLKTPLEFVNTSFDLLILYAEDGDLEELDATATETLERVREMSSKYGTELVSLVHRWRLGDIGSPSRISKFKLQLQVLAKRREV